MTSKELYLKLDQMTAYAAAAEINRYMGSECKRERIEELHRECEAIKSQIIFEFNEMSQYLK